jgi:hypothetical protein
MQSAPRNKGEKERSKKLEEIINVAKDLSLDGHKARSCDENGDAL